MKKAIKLMEQIAETQKEIRKESENYIRKALEKSGGTISFENPKGEVVSVTYDGGRHPEYASNAFSMVEDAFLNDKNEICLNTEDCEEYEISRIDWDEVYDVAMFIHDIVKAG